MPPVYELLRPSRSNVFCIMLFHMHERGGDWLSDLVKPARNKENMWPVGNSNKRMSIGNRLSTPSLQMSNVFRPTREEDIDFCLGGGGVGSHGYDDGTEIPLH